MIDYLETLKDTSVDVFGVGGFGVGGDIVSLYK
jgi:hypothetical protein